MRVFLTRSARRGIALAAALTLAAGMFASPAAALPGTPTITTVTWPDNPVRYLHQAVDVVVNVSPAPAAGIVTMYLEAGATDTAQHVNSVNPVTGDAYMRLYSVDPLPDGDYTLYAQFTGGGDFLDSTSTSHLVEIRRDTQVLVVEPVDASVTYLDTAYVNVSADFYTPWIELWDSLDGAPAVKVGEAAPSPRLGGGYATQFHFPALEIGVHEFHAASTESVSTTAGTSDPVAVVVSNIPTEPSWWSGSIIGGIPFDAIFYVFRPGIGIATGATGTGIVRIGSTILDTCTVVNGQCDLRLTIPAGTHTITSEYGGDATFAASERDDTLEIGADWVDVTGVGLDRTTFYPYKDGYKDTVRAKGARSEPASVSIKVHSPTGKLLKSTSIATGTGGWSWSWNGRTATGTMYPAGKYRITQVVSDKDGAPAASATFTSYVILSTKRLYTYTKTLTKNYAHRSAQAANSVAWQFTLPSATVYKKLVFKVYAKSGSGGGFGPHDFRWCAKATWDLDCASPAAALRTSFAWRSVTGSVTANRSGTYVRLYALATTRSNLKYGRVVVTYGVLK